MLAFGYLQDVWAEVYQEIWVFRGDNHLESLYYTFDNPPFISGLKSIVSTSLADPCRGENTANVTPADGSRVQFPTSIESDPHAIDSGLLVSRSQLPLVDQRCRLAPSLGTRWW